MSERAARLAIELGVSSADPQTSDFRQELQKKFSQKYPSTKDPNNPGHETLEGKLDNRLYMALARLGIESIGCLQLCSTEELRPHKQSDRREQIGQGSFGKITALLEARGKQLRHSGISYAEAAKIAFGNPVQIPMAWLRLNRTLNTSECFELVHRWGLRCLGDLVRVPRKVLLLLEDTHGNPTLSEPQLKEIQTVLKKVNLKLRTK